MSQIAVGLVVAASLVLTAYFGAAAWHASDDHHTDISGRIALAGESRPPGIEPGQTANGK